MKHLKLLIVSALLTLTTSAVAQKQADSLGKATVKLDEVFVEGRTKVRHLNSVSQRLSSTSLSQQVGQSLAEVLERISGMSSIQSGVAHSKPVIHGMHGNRILIVNNGARQTGQQWNEGHAPEIDISSSGEVYVLKGAESVRYGSEALGGVIVLEQSPLLYHQGDSLSGKANLQYASNGRRFSGNALANFSLKSLRHFAFRLQASAANNGDYSTAKYLINNTGGREYAGLLGVGYKRGRYKIESYLSHYYERQGIMQASNLGNEQTLREVIERGQPIVFTPWSRAIDYPNEQVHHTNLSLKAEYKTPHWGLLKYQFTYQHDHRQEFRIRRNNNSHIPELDLKLQSVQHLLRWEHQYGKAWQSELGALHQGVENHSVPGNGVVPVIPNYTEQSWGIYGIQRYDAERWGAELGLRLDGQTSKATGYDITGKLYGGARSFSNISYNLGGRYQISYGLTLKSNIGVAWRAPHVHELYSNGANHGSAAFVRGYEDLDSEESYKWISSLSWRKARLSLRLDAYLQWVRNYIYDEPKMQAPGRAEVIQLISGTYPIFQFKQTNAFFRGIDLEIDYELTKHLSYGLRTALIYANEVPSGLYLPYIPPMRINHELKYQLPKLSKKSDLSITLEHTYVSRQRRFDPNKDLIPYAPPAYHLLGAELEWSYDKWLSLRLSGQNLLNTEYKEYTNRARYYSHDLGRNIRLALSVKL